MFSKADIEKYFNAEKAESWVFMAIGITGIILAVIFLFIIKTNIYKGAAVPLALAGLLLGIIGYAVYARSDSDRIRNVYAYDMNPAELKEKEIPRMEVVMKNFVIYRYIEIVLGLTGAGLFFYFRNNIDKQFFAGLGIGLLIMAVTSLTADFFAEKRGHLYLKKLKEFTKSK